MSRLLFEGGEEGAAEIVALSITETLGTAVMTVSVLALETSITDTLGSASMISVSPDAGVSQAWIAQG